MSKHKRMTKVISDSLDSIPGVWVWIGLLVSMYLRWLSFFLSIQDPWDRPPGARGRGCDQRYENRWSHTSFEEAPGPLYDLPDTAEKYIHCVGRTGRAGQAGVSYALFLPQACGVIPLWVRRSLNRRGRIPHSPSFTVVSRKQSPTQTNGHPYTYTYTYPSCSIPQAALC